MSYLFGSGNERLTDRLCTILFLATIPYIPLSYALVIVTYYRRHLLASCHLHIMLADVCDTYTCGMCNLEFDFRVILHYP